MTFLELLKRPSSWISVTAGALLAWLVVAPGLQKQPEPVAVVTQPVSVQEEPPAPPAVSDPKVSLYLPPEPAEEAVPAMPAVPAVGGTLPSIPAVEPNEKMVVQAVPATKSETAGVASAAPQSRPEIEPMLSPEEIADLLKTLPVAKPVESWTGPLTQSEMERVMRETFVGPQLPEIMEEEWRQQWVGPMTPSEMVAESRRRFVGPLTELEMEWEWRKGLVGPLHGPFMLAEWQDHLMGPPLAGEDPLFAEVMGLLGDEASMRGEDSEFAHDDEEIGGKGDKKVAGTSQMQKPNARITPPPAPEKSVAAVEPAPKAPEPAPPPLSEEPLPPAQGNVWKVVKIDGRDYVTGQSIQMFYRFSTHKVDGKHVWFRNPNLILKAQIGSQELLVNNIKFIMSYPVLSQGGQALFSRLDLCKLIEPVIRPSYISTNSIFDTVVLDAGHGGHDSGAKGVYGYEKNYALAMVFSVREALIKRGFKVLLTRSNDTFLPLSTRVALANKTPNSIFISIHFNSGGSAASGIETFALTPQGSASSIARGGGFSNDARLGNQFDSENIALATAVHAQVVHRFKLIDRGIKRARWTVLTGCNRPGILFEGGFVTNARECQLIASDNYRKAVADAIGDAVVNFKRALAPQAAKR
jgi:N-acetylmuramoyl-L-alanine amidase